jgi:hypothetical protein
MVQRGGPHRYRRPPVRHHRVWSLTDLKAGQRILSVDTYRSRSKHDPHPTERRCRDRQAEAGEERRTAARAEAGERSAASRAEAGERSAASRAEAGERLIRKGLGALRVVVERRGNDAASLRLTGCTTPRGAMKTGVPQDNHSAADRRRAAGARRADGVILDTVNRPLHNQPPCHQLRAAREREWISTPTLNSRYGS